MSLFDPHIDRQLERFTAGTLSPRRFKRMTAHARSCARCGERYDRAVLAHRVLETGSMRRASSPEIAALDETSLQAALAAAGRPSRAPLFGRAAWVAGALAASAAAVLLFVRAPKDEFAARGGPRVGHDASLRVFCTSGDDELVELAGGAACPAGATLAFASGARLPLRHVAIAVRGGGAQIVIGPLPVAAPPDQGAPLDETPVLSLPPGPAEIVAAFADDPDRAAAALAGSRVEGALVLRQAIVVEKPR